MRQYLASQDIPVRELIVPDEDPDALIAGIQPGDRHLILEYSRWGDKLRQVKIKFPHIKLHVRTVNAEAWHFLHQVAPVYRPLAAAQRYYGACRLLMRDAACRRHADSLLGISRWDDQHYWRWLPGRARIHTAPSHSPWPLLRPHVTPMDWSSRKQSIISMPGTTASSIGRTTAENFAVWAGRCDPSSKSAWEFALTHHPDAWGPEPDERWNALTIIRDCAEPWDLLCRVKALAALTPLGFGCKSTVLDALAAGCHVLVHPVIARRLEPALREACIVVDPLRSPVEPVLDLISKPPAYYDTNHRLQKLAMAGLKKALT